MIKAFDVIEAGGKGLLAVGKLPAIDGGDPHARYQFCGFSA